MASISAFDAAEGVRRCPGCGVIENRGEVTPVLTSAPCKSPFLSETTDGVLLASPAFQKRYAAEGWQGLRFSPLRRGYARVDVLRTVRLVADRQYHYDRTLLEPGIASELPDTHVVVNHTACCPTCERYRETLGGGARVIARGEVPVGPEEFVAGDIAFGEGDHRIVDLIVGAAIRPAHLRERLREVSVFTKVGYQRWDVRPRRNRETGQIIEFPDRSSSAVAR